MGHVMTNDPIISTAQTLTSPLDESSAGIVTSQPEPLNYGLVKLVLNRDRFVPISRDVFDKVTVARDCLMQLVFIEEKFDFVVENLAALERAVLESADLCKTASITNVEVQVNKSDINRHVANLVALGRMFIEQSLIHVKKLKELTGGELFDLASARALQYDARLGYQLFEELRNYMLHRSSAVHYAEYRTNKEYDAEGTMTLQHKVMVYTSVVQLGKDHKFKKRVLKQLEAIGDNHDLIAMARDYVAGLWDAQLEYRSAMADFVFDTEWAYTQVAYLYAEVDVKDEVPNVTALAAVACTADGSIREKTSIVYDLIAQRKHYELKNDEIARKRLG